LGEVHATLLYEHIPIFFKATIETHEVKIDVVENIDIVLGIESQGTRPAKRFHKTLARGKVGSNLRDKPCLATGPFERGTGHVSSLESVLIFSIKLIQVKLFSYRAKLA